MADERCTLLLLMVFVVKQLSAEELTCDPKTVSLKDFNIDKFLGTWYEVYHYPANPQEHYYCCIDDYEKTLAGDVTIASSLYDKT
ncbi:hypothetical protein L798_05073 [Zootermopsis nevadensis]|uniref:Apolipoprotein D n=1 Tax=Zootermopsis nevadensis TaxID=136037 RepID=A0A067QF30_ZOONE|nr:hypothetical protein L798_05073 [Zootermopsis nevadensis]